MAALTQAFVTTVMADCTFPTLAQQLFKKYVVNLSMMDMHREIGAWLMQIKINLCIPL